MLDIGGFTMEADAMAGKKWLGVLTALAVCFIVAFLPEIVHADGFSGDVGNRPGSADRTTSSRGLPPDGGFAGTWYGFVDNTAFTMIIEQNGRIVKVAHTAVYDYGRRVDSSVGSVSMVGAIEGSTALMEWKSGLSPETGKATIEYIPGKPVTLHWRITDEPKKPDDQSDSPVVEVSYFLPRSAFLIRK